MATNQVQVQINGKDNLSGVISGIKTNFLGLGAVASTAMLGIGAAIGGAAVGVGGLVASIASAEEVVSSRIGAIGNAAYFMGTDFAGAAPLVDSVADSLNRAAASLPGNTADYTAMANSLYDSVIPAFMDLNGVLDEQGAKSAIEDMATNFTLLGQQAERTGQESRQAMAKLLAGQSSELELMQSDFFSNNQPFVDALKKQAEERNLTLTELIKGDSRELIEAANAAAKAVVTPEMKSALQNTISGTLEGMRDSLFNSRTGLFGALRTVQVDGVDTNVYDEANSALQSINGLVESIQGFLSGLGLTIDPMQMAASALRNITDWTDNLTAWVDSLDSLSSIEPPEINLTGITDRLATAIPNFLSGLTQAINSLPMEQLGRDIGARLATSFMSFMGSEAGPNTSELTAGIVAQLPSLTLAILQLPIRAFNSIRQFIWSVAGTIGGQILSGLGAITGQVVQGAMNVTTQIGSALYNLHMQIASFAFNAISGLAGMVIGAVTGGAASVGSAISSAISSLFSRIRSAVSSILSSIPLPSFGGLGGGGGGQSVGRRASGNNLSALNRVIRREEADSGGRAVIANSTEMIIPQRNLGQLVGAIQGGRQQGGSPVTNNFTIVQQPGQPSEELVQQIVRMMSKQSRGQLA